MNVLVTTGNTYSCTIGVLPRLNYITYLAIVLNFSYPILEVFLYFSLNEIRDRIVSNIQGGTILHSRPKKPWWDLGGPLLTGQTILSKLKVSVESPKVFLQFNGDKDTLLEWAKDATSSEGILKDVSLTVAYHSFFLERIWHAEVSNGVMKSESGVNINGTGMRL